MVPIDCRGTQYLKVTSKKSVSLGRTRPCMYTSNKNIKILVRIHSTVKVIRACLFICLSVLVHNEYHQHVSTTTQFHVLLDAVLDKLHEIQTHRRHLQTAVHAVLVDAGIDKGHQRRVVGQPSPPPRLKISKIEKNVSIDHTRPCIQTYNKNKKIHVRITSTVKVIRARIFILLAVLKGTQREYNQHVQ